MDNAKMPEPTTFDVEQADRKGHILMLDGKPALLAVGLRDARKMPNRQHVLLAVEVATDDEGNVGVAPLFEMPMEMN